MISFVFFLNISIERKSRTVPWGDVAVKKRTAKFSEGHSLRGDAVQAHCAPCRGSECFDHSTTTFGFCGCLTDVPL